MSLKTILISLLLCSEFLFSQETNKQVLQLEHKGDSIYFNLSKYSTKDHVEKGVSIYKSVLALTKDSTSHRYKTISAKKFSMQAAFHEYSMQYDSAIVYSKRSIKLLGTFKNRDLLLEGLTYKRLYKQWFTLKNTDSVIAAAKKARKTLTDTLGVNHRLVAEVVFDLGMAYGWKGLTDKNIEYYKKAININIASNGEYTPECAIQEHHLALTYGFIGYYKKELESYKKVIQRWENMDYHDMSYLNVAYGSLCTWYLEHGDVKTAEKYLLKQEALLKNYKSDINNWFNETYKGRTEVNNWGSLANLALYKKDTLKALFYNDKVLNFVTKFDANDKSNNPHNLSYFKDFVDLGEMRALALKASIIKEKQPKKAKNLYEEILRINENPVVATATLNEKLNILDFYIHKKDFKTAQEKIEDYTRIAKEKKSDYILMHLYAKGTNILLAENNFNKFDSNYKEVFRKLQRDTTQDISIQNLKLEDCKPYGDGNIVNIIRDAADNYSEAYKVTSKKDFLKNAHNLSALVSSIFSNNFSYLPYNEEKYKTITHINEQLLNTALLLKGDVKVDSVLEHIEETGSKLSWKKFLASNQRENLNIPDSILEKESDLKSSLHFYKKKLFVDSENDEDKVKQYKKKLYDIEIEMERLEVWYSKNYPSYYNQTQKPFSLKLLKQKLKKKQRIIKYIIAKENIYAFVITSKVTQLIKLGNKTAFNKKIEALIKTLTKINSEDYIKLAQELYNELLPESILGNSKNQDLIFIQDDVLHFVPMEILIDSKNTYLIQTHKVSYAPSLLLWEEQLKAKKSKQNKLGIFVPTYKKQKSDTSRRDDNSELLGANAEAFKIGKLFNSDIYSEEKATKQEFIANAQDYSILHLAMHSTINNTEAEFSNLSFSSDDSEKLFISELYNIPLNADLAVLSACNTGSGILDKGEGLVNVSKAFTYAGVPSIVMSLWQVPDKETSLIMVSFYKYLEKGSPKNEALQLAKLEYLNTVEDDVLKHPYYWAGFVISGDVSALESNSKIGLIVLILAGILVLFLFRKQLIKFFK